MGSFGEVTEFGHGFKSQFLFDPKYTNLNHGSFGTYSLPVRNALRGYQKLAEAAPDKFLRYQYVDLLDKSRERIARLINAPVDECVFVQNATTGVNTILRNLQFKEKDCIIYFDTIYGACEKTLASIVETNPQLHLRKVGHGQDFGYALPCTHPEILNSLSQTISRVLYDGYNPRVCIFDTIVSLPGVRFPFERITKMCKEYGILSLIDGAHAVGMIPLNMAQLDPDFFVSNCHKWLYTPRGCAVLHVPKRNQHLIRTTFPTSHGYTPPADASSKIRNPLPPTEKSPFVNLFQFVATADNAPYYCVPAAINFRQNLCGGEEAIYNYIRDIAQRGADLLAMVLGTEVMDDLDQGHGLKTMGSYEASDRREGGRVGWSGGLRDCAMANVLLPITIQGATSRGSISMGPGGAGSAGGLSPALRQASYGFPSGGNSVQPPRSAAVGNMLGEPRTLSVSPLHSPSLPSAGPTVVQEADVATHKAWMERTLVDEYNTFVAIYEYDGRLWTRVSGQIYLELKDFEWLGEVLKSLCERVRSGESMRGKEPKPEFKLPDLETWTLKSPKPPSRSSTVGTPVKRFDITQGGWVEE
ncbi:selenocysteine lyase [Exophiala viscosa]|uniref:Selenocysteine lyase n=1 Tax=Exophiala viscosa TaxID=2486360 RepID=A0AAN6IBL6_9EURO|nr:selenocysteine lyase [Exophiala viscosa]KAI1623722.1 selenocysteine lyase [Exophiala viscosa]